MTSGKTSLNELEFRIHGVKIHALQVKYATELIEQWISDRSHFRYLVSSNINNVVTALESDEYYDVMENADMSVPDGVPFLWLGRLKGFSLRRRCGIEEIMVALFELSNQGKNYRHYFYGNTRKVLDDLQTFLLAAYPKLNIVGMNCPPFRNFSPQETQKDIEMINNSNADFLWVSLGCPKQELWLYRNRNELKVPFAGGAGAVFNFMSGDTIKAPTVIQYIGLEWLMRLLLDPKRLWRRYLIRYPKFFMYYFPTNKS